MKKNFLLEMYNEHSGKVSDKWAIYLNAYDRIFSKYRKKKVRVLEVGIQNGGSLEIWSRYFARGDIFIGCDINENCRDLEYEDVRIHVVVGDANAKITHQAITALSERFDIIIDDGSHKSSEIIKTFCLYFENISDDGVYIIEDLHCSYWKNFEGGLYHPYSSISFFKNLVDIVNHEHWGVEKSRKSIIQDFARKYKIDIDEHELASIHSIEFINSTCIIHKASPERNTLGKRIVVGDTATVAPTITDRRGEIQRKTDQSENEWAARALSLHEDLTEKLTELRNTQNRLKKTETLVAEAHSRNDDLQELLETVEKNRNVLREKCEIVEANLQTTREKLAQAELIKSRLESRLEETRIALDEKDASFRAVQDSRSWRITAPYRRAGGLFKRTARLGFDFRQAVYKRGGVFASGRLVLGAFRRKGWRGVRERLFQIASENNSYSDWVQRYSTVSPDMRVRITDLIGEMEQPPTISIVMSVFNPDLDWFAKVVASVREQLYPHWQLSIADDCSIDSRVRPFLLNLQDTDSRVRVVLRESHGDTSAALNTAASFATGSFLAVMDQNDLLAEDALFEVARAIKTRPDAALIYSDEDKVNIAGTRFDPYFKCNWNPDLFLSCNFVSQLGVFRKNIFDDLGGFRSEYDGSQDYDLALRFVELLRSEQIVHIPRVLYHRLAQHKNAAEPNGKPNPTLQAGQRALEDHLQRQDIKANVQNVRNGYRIRYALPNPLPLVSLIVPTRNALPLLRQCIGSILQKTTYPHYEIIVIDNNSDDPETLSYLVDLAKNSRVKVVRDERPFNYSALNNAAVGIAKGQYIGLINNDIEVITHEWLEEMVAFAARPGVGAVGARLWYPNDTLQHGGVIVGLGGVASHAHKGLARGQSGYFARAELVQTMTAVTAACLILRKSSFIEVGGLNEDDLAIAFNDVDLCLKLKEAGYRNVWTPYAELYHHESATRGLDDDPQKMRRFQSELEYMKSRWHTDVFSDPAYSPNLTSSAEDFSLAWPPRVEL